MKDFNLICHRLIIYICCNQRIHSRLWQEFNNGRMNIFSIQLRSFFPPLFPLITKKIVGISVTIVAPVQLTEGFRSDFSLLNPHRHMRTERPPLQPFIFSSFPFLFFLFIKPHLHSSEKQAVGQGDLDVPRARLTFAQRVKTAGK